MANQEHLDLLRQGVKVWNEWRRENPEITPDLRGAVLRGADLRGAKLSRASLSEANFIDANLTHARLIKANLSGASFSGVYLSGADLRMANLRGVNLRVADLSEAILKEADLSRAALSKASFRRANLRRACLRGAHLEEADLGWASLSAADLSGASLRMAKLRGTQALSTNFNGATFTGACLEDWSINSETNLDNVICDYVYLKANQLERRPSSGNFASGDFTTLFRKVLHTVDLVFRDGIDWQAFLVSFQKLQVECGGDELSIQSFENKGDGAFVIRVNVPRGADKAEIEKYLKKPDQLEAQLEAKNEQLANLMEITKLLASRPINVEATGNKFMPEASQKNVTQNVSTNTGQMQALAAGRDVEAKAVTQGNTYNQSGNFGIGHMSGGEIKEGAKVAGVINEAEQQNLAEAAAEIQALLKQLEQSYPTDTTAGKMAIATEAIERIDSDPTLTERILSALKAGGISALEQLLNHPAASFVIGALEDWQKTQTSQTE